MPNFLKPENRPAGSPDLDLMDYFVWGALKQMVCASPVKAYQVTPNMRFSGRGNGFQHSKF
uniref:Uncharacterized protein n=1 Tax=Romanomermis culicivorax TaxID=13658 RepID=A0A915JM79_ROMCU